MAKSIEQRLNRLEAELKRQRNVNQALRNQMLNLASYLLEEAVTQEAFIKMHGIEGALKALNPGGYHNFN